MLLLLACGDTPPASCPSGTTLVSGACAATDASTPDASARDGDVLSDAEHLDAVGNYVDHLAALRAVH